MSAAGNHRRRSPLRGLLLFLLGGLVGANATYYAMTRGSGSAPRVATPAPAAATTPPGTSEPAAAPDRALVRATPTPAQPEAESALAEGPVLAAPAVRASGVASTGEASAGAGGLLIPVQGITAAQLLDTFNDARGSGRVHDAIDIMAAAGTPVLAVADGRVEKLFESKLGGTTLYQFNREGSRAYYYAHLQRYAPGIAEQQILRRGQVIGYVGSSGNASPEAPHLHFAIFELGPERQWWKGTAINPYPLLGGTPR